ncbi:MAG: adenosylmethionine--8-amino-7-oxononanoate transaminase [Kiritimatiellae bacterium]|nr:adenosylmethionine--8-amino-7-oxononanoate transaminase [Kiritimatiellia bacterium]
MNPDQLRQLDRAHVWHPYTPRPDVDRGLPIIVRAEGPWLFDTEGRRWFDGIASWWCSAVGHNHPRIVAAIRRQVGELDHSILGGLAHPAAVRLAAELARMMPDSRAHVHFASDGASAVEAAVKIALQYHAITGAPERTELVALEGAYHGDTLGAIGLGFLEHFHAPFRTVCRRAIRVPPPCGGVTVGEATAAARDAFAQHRGRIAAVIVEPMVQGAAGMRMYAAEWLRELYGLARDAGALFIADEIATGFGRTGRWFAFEHAGIAPDIVCVGKALSGGTLPISAAIVRDHIYDAFDGRSPERTFLHGHTFAGQPVAAAAALAALELYRELDLPALAVRIGVALEQRWAALRGQPAVREVRILGAVGAIELGGSAPAAAAAQVRDELRRRAILLRPLGGVVYLMPPLTTPEPDLAAVADAVREATLGAL